MKTKSTIIAASSVLVVAVLLGVARLTSPAIDSVTADAGSNGAILRKHASPREISRGLAGSPKQSKTTRESRPQESATVTHWTKRLDELEREGNDSKQATQILLGELARSFEEEVRDVVLGLEGLPPLQRHARLVDLQGAVGQETGAVLNHLGIDGEEHMKVTAAAMQPVWAELIYAGAASDPASRLTLLRLEMERLSRLKAALAANEAETRDQAVADLGGWHQAELQAVLANPAAH